MKSKRLMGLFIVGGLLLFCGHGYADDTKIGDTYYHSNGDTSTQIGDTMFNSDDDTDTYGW